LSNKVTRSPNIRKIVENTDTIDINHVPLTLRGEVQSVKTEKNLDANYKKGTGAARDISTPEVKAALPRTRRTPARSPAKRETGNKDDIGKEQDADHKPRDRRFGKLSP